MAAAHIDLHRWQDELGHRQGGVPTGAHRDEVVFVHPLMNVDVADALRAHGRLPDIPVAPRSLVVVAQEQPRLVGQLHQSTDRAE
ncbi:hypothetical protein WR25_25577 [Diploscapter pachys]|uniref:Uncharacterized protein n=1 Tax=Diploscapter pachys TaxID=2018661 RepID=A0A2A2JW91_9BILA|nr:hypothetical protein WR25_25577 [Diploscapter pachys]